MEPHYMGRVGLELAQILWPQPPQCWDYKHVTPRPAVI